MGARLCVQPIRWELLTAPDLEVDVGLVRGVVLHGKGPELKALLQQPFGGGNETGCRHSDAQEVHGPVSMESIHAWRKLGFGITQAGWGWAGQGRGAHFLAE